MLYKEEVIKLTVAVYQVTGNFPENEPLRAQIRQKANIILADFVCLAVGQGRKNRISAEIEALGAYFSIAEKQNWVDEKNFLVLRREYDKISDFIVSLPEKQEQAEKRETKIGEEEKISEPQLSADKKSKDGANRISANPFIRQKHILELLKTKDQVLLSEIKSLFSSLSSRTLRRDLSALVNRGAIDRIRQGREDVSYALK